MADRWARLAPAWLDPAADRAGRRPRAGQDRQRPGTRPRAAWLPETRRAALAELAALDARAPCSPPAPGVPSLVARHHWLRPRRRGPRARPSRGRSRRPPSSGSPALGGLSAHGRALLDRRARGRRGGAGAAAARTRRPRAAPGRPDRRRARAARAGPRPRPRHGRRRRVPRRRDRLPVHRGSVRHAFDSGWSAAEVHESIAPAPRGPRCRSRCATSSTTSPARFGTVRVGAAESFLRSDDEAALAELVHDPRAAALRLRRIAPTVVVSDVPLDVLLPRLRELGVGPGGRGPRTARSGSPARDVAPRPRRPAARGVAADGRVGRPARRAGRRHGHRDPGRRPGRRSRPPRPARGRPAIPAVVARRCCARRSRPAPPCGSATSTTTARAPSGSSTRRASRAAGCRVRPPHARTSGPSPSTGSPPSAPSPPPPLTLTLLTAHHSRSSRPPFEVEPPLVPVFRRPVASGTAYVGL